MIGHLQGILLKKQPLSLLLEVQGIGYEVDVPMSTFYHLPETGEQIKLYTHLLVREDAHLLYGFYTEEERLLFRTLLKVSGVGARLALTILSNMAPLEFVRSVLENDLASLIKLPGVGKKTAERLVIEMRDKLATWQDGAGSSAVDHSPRQMVLQDAISALIELGYKSQEANRVITKVDDGQGSVEALIRQALREMM